MADNVMIEILEWLRHGSGRMSETWQAEAKERLSAEQFAAQMGMAQKAAERGYRAQVLESIVDENWHVAQGVPWTGSKPSHASVLVLRADLAKKAKTAAARALKLRSRIDSGQVWEEEFSECKNSGYQASLREAAKFAFWWEEGQRARAEMYEQESAKFWAWVQAIDAALSENIRARSDNGAGSSAVCGATT